MLSLDNPLYKKNSIVLPTRWQSLDYTFKAHFHNRLIHKFGKYADIEFGYLIKQVSIFVCVQNTSVFVSHMLVL